MLQAVQQLQIDGIEFIGFIGFHKLNFNEIKFHIHIKIK